MSKILALIAKLRKYKAIIKWIYNIIKKFKKEVDKNPPPIKEILNAKKKNV